jgi:hypothetical protein
MTRNKSYRFIFHITVLLLLSRTANSQRINFNTWAGSNSISIQAVSGSTSLEFGNIFSGQTKSILLNASEVTAFEITAAEGYDLTVSVSSPTVLDGPDNKAIPISLNFAYSDQGAAIASLAKTNAQEVPAGFTSVTFPVRRSASGLPAPPPIPLDGTTTTRPTAKAYLFIYGSIGPVPSDASAGDYTGTVNIMVEYDNY